MNFRMILNCESPEIYPFPKTFVGSFSLEIGNPEQTTEILKDVYALKRNSPGLSKEVFDVEFVCSDPQNPVKFRVVMPGENGYEGRRTASVYSSDPQTEAKENEGSAK